MNVKPYKADTPNGTVARIRKIITEQGLPVNEELLGDGANFCSCRIFLSHDKDSTIGTNGKGMNPEFSLASGYAEFMERLQNRVLVYPNPASIGQDCRFYPDEQAYKFSRKQAEEQIKRFAPRVLPDEGLTAEQLEGVALPFFHVNSGTVENVPYSLIRWINGSNGMAAGNIREEAIIQGFCEIFERYCIQEMYRRKIVPPNVPVSAFEGSEVLKRLNELSTKHGMEWSIKDYSLGEGFPVLGILLFNRDKSKYILHLGADLDPKIALERCYTEIFQGYTAETLSFENDVNSCERLNTFNEFKRSLMYGRGRQHENFFTGAPSYAYTGHTTIPVGNNFREDLHNICRWVVDKGYNIYIRDNSFLGFPTVHIVVPGLSEIDKDFCRLNRRVCHMQLTENRINPLFRFADLSNDECIETIDYLQQLDKPVIELFPLNNNPSNSVNRYLLIFFLNIKLGRKIDAIANLESYFAHCKQNNINARQYYHDMLCILKGISTDENSQSFKIASAFLSQPEKALSAIDTPKCFNCEACKLANGCRFPLLREIESIIQKAMAEYIPQQSSLSELFAQQ